MSGIATDIKLGRPTNEVIFSTTGVEMPAELSHSPETRETKIRGWGGKLFTRGTSRYRPNFAFTIDSVSEASMQQLESLRRIQDCNLAFIWANSRALYSERVLSTDTLHLTLPDDSITLGAKEYKAAGGTDSSILSVTGVFNQYSIDGSQVGTNYYAGGGGSYSAATRIITLDNPLPDDSTICYVNLTYKGCAVRFAMGGLKPVHVGGHFDGGPRWGVQIQLEGA